jgi:hypothetical protein
VTNTSALCQFTPGTIARRVSFRIDEATARSIKATHSALVAVGIRPTSDSDLLRYALQKLDEALRATPLEGGHMAPEALRLVVANGSR